MCVCVCSVCAFCYAICNVLPRVSYSSSQHLINTSTPIPSPYSPHRHSSLTQTTYTTHPPTHPPPGPALHERPPPSLFPHEGVRPRSVSAAARHRRVQQRRRVRSGRVRSGRGGSGRVRSGRFRREGCKRLDEGCQDKGRVHGWCQNSIGYWLWDRVWDPVCHPVCRTA